MSDELIARAEAVRARYRVLESCPGSGYHDDDRNVARPERFQAPQRNGLPRASDHLVAFFDHAGEEVLFAGPDATRAWDALQAWFWKARQQDPLNLSGTERKLLGRIVPRLQLHDGLLAVRLDQWNDVLAALHSEGMGISGQHLEA